MKRSDVHGRVDSILPAFDLRCPMRFIEQALAAAITNGPMGVRTMRICLNIKCAVRLSLLLMAFPMSAAYAEVQFVDGNLILAPIEAPVVMAAGAVEDTLKACLSRIPADASAGQRMLAEQSCKGEEANRDLVSLAPKF